MAKMIANVIKATGVSTFRTNLKSSLDNVYNLNQTLIVTRPADENIVVISEDYYNELQKRIQNLEYLLKLSESDKQIETGELSNFDLNNM